MIKDYYPEKKELYLCCDCMELDHVMGFIYLTPTPEEKGGEFDEIYVHVRAENMYNWIVPPIPFLHPITWRDYFYFHFFKRFKIALGYIANKHYEFKGGIFNAFDFQSRDLDAFDNFLSQPCEFDDEVKTLYPPSLYIENHVFRLKFESERAFDDMDEYKLPEWPLWIGWELQFKPRNIFKRIWHAGKYFFGRYCTLQEFGLDREKALALRSIIKYTQELNDAQRKEYERQKQADNK